MVGVRVMCIDDTVFTSVDGADCANLITKDLDPVNTNTLHIRMFNMIYAGRPKPTLAMTHDCNANHELQ